MNEPRWLVRAYGYVGLAEVNGTKHNPQILKFWKLLGLPFKDDETPWCQGFVGGVLEEVGIRASRSGMARSNLKWGEKLKGPAVGAIVVFSRGPVSGHVGFVVGKDRNGNIMVLGGNQGDAVNIKPFSTSRVLGYRWPTGEPLPRSYELPIVNSNGKLSTRESFVGGAESETSEESGSYDDESWDDKTETAVVAVDGSSAAQTKQIQESADSDNETRGSWLVRKWRGLTGLISGGAATGLLGFLTSPWAIVAVFGCLLIIGVIIVLFMGPSDVRAWVRKQVS